MSLRPGEKLLIPTLALGIFITATLVYLSVTDGIPPRVTGEPVLVGTLVGGRLILARPPRQPGEQQPVNNEGQAQ